MGFLKTKSYELWSCPLLCIYQGASVVSPSAEEKERSIFGLCCCWILSSPVFLDLPVSKISAMPPEAEVEKLHSDARVLLLSNPPVKDNIFPFFSPQSGNFGLCGSLCVLTALQLILPLHKPAKAKLVGQKRSSCWHWQRGTCKEKDKQREIRAWIK